MSKFNIKKHSGNATGAAYNQINVRRGTVSAYIGTMTIKHPSGTGIIKSPGPYELFDKDDLRQQKMVGTGHPFNLVQNNGTFLIHDSLNRLYYSHSSGTPYPTSILSDCIPMGGAAITDDLMSDYFRHFFHNESAATREEANKLFASAGRGCGLSYGFEWKHWLEAQGSFSDSNAPARYGQAFWIPKTTVPASPSTPPVVVNGANYHLSLEIPTYLKESGPHYSFGIWIRVDSGGAMIMAQNKGAMEVHYSDPLVPMEIPASATQWHYISGSGSADGYVIPPIRLYATPNTVFKIALPHLGIGQHIMMPWNHLVPVMSANKLKLY